MVRLSLSLTRTRAPHAATESAAPLPLRPSSYIQRKRSGSVDPEVQNPLAPRSSSRWVRLQQEAHGLRTQKFAQERAAVTMLVTKLSGGAGKLTFDQIKNMYKSFKSMDTDKSGDVDYNEFTKGMGLVDSAAARTMFQSFDLDSSGAIDMHEFIDLLAAYAHLDDTALGTGKEDRLRAISVEVDQEEEEKAQTMPAKPEKAQQKKEDDKARGG